MSEDQFDICEQIIRIDQILADINRAWVSAQARLVLRRA
jgi:hypothetical protein